MKKPPRARWLALVGLLLACSADDLLGQHACTEIGCLGGFSLTLKPAEGAFPAGTYELLVATAEGGPARRCTFTLPAADPTATVPGTCAGDVSVSVAPEVTCSTTTRAGSATQSCTPIPGKFEQNIQLRSLPARVRIIQRTGTDTFFDRELPPTYRTVYPNGPDCPPGCRGASETGTFSFADRPSPGVSCAPSACATDADCAQLGRPGTTCIQKPLAGPCVQYACE